MLNHCEDNPSSVDKIRYCRKNKRGAGTFLKLFTTGVYPSLPAPPPPPPPPSHTHTHTAFHSIHVITHICHIKFNLLENKLVKLAELGKMTIFTSFYVIKVGKNMSVLWFKQQPAVSADHNIAMALPTWGRHDAILCGSTDQEKQQSNFLHFNTPLADLRSSESKESGDLNILMEHIELRVRCS